MDVLYYTVRFDVGHKLSTGMHYVTESLDFSTLNSALKFYNERIEKGTHRVDLVECKSVFKKDTRIIKHYDVDKFNIVMQLLDIT